MKKTTDRMNIKREDGQQQYIYATVSHRPTSTQIDALIAEQTTD